MKTRDHILAVCLIFFTYTSYAQWTKTNGPSEVSATVIEQYNSKLFLGTAQSGIFKSVNSAVSWTRLNSFPDSASITGISKIIDFNDTLFVSTYNGIYKSDDSGATWKYANAGIPDTMFKYNLFNADGILFATAYALDWVTSVLYTNVYSYNTTSLQWNQLPNLSPDLEIKSIAALHDTVFFAIPGHGIFKTHNLGSNWDSVGMGPIPTNNVTLLACNGSIMYALGQSGGTELLSSANGITWASSLISILAYNPVNSFTVSHDTLLLGSPGEITASYDGGNNWALYSLPYYYNFNDIEFISNRVYAADLNSGVNYSTDIANWTYANTGLPYATSYHIANPFSNLYAMDYFSTFHSGNSGNTWSLDTNITWGMNAMARMGNKLIGFTGSAQYNLISWDQGLNWLYDTGTGASIVVSDALVDNDHRKLYAWGQNDVRRSDDYGGSWNSLFYANGVVPHDTIFTSLTRIKNRLFLTARDTSDHLLYSDDSGSHWTLNTVVGGVYHAVAVDTVLVIGTSSGIKYSTDMGNSFINSLVPISLNNTFVNGHLLFSFNSPPMLNTISYSSDYGVTWFDISDTNVSAVYGLAMDNNYLYAATQSNAVWRLALSGIPFTYTPDTSNNYVLPNSVSTIAHPGGEELSFFPNPFNAQINIGLVLQNTHYVDVRLYDALGRCVQIVSQGSFSAGKHNFTFSKDIPAGIYYVVAMLDGTPLTGKIIKQ